MINKNTDKALAALGKEITETVDNERFDLNAVVVEFEEGNLHSALHLIQKVEARNKHLKQVILSAQILNDL